MEQFAVMVYKSDCDEILQKLNVHNSKVKCNTHILCCSKSDLAVNLTLVMFDSNFFKFFSPLVCLPPWSAHFCCLCTSTNELCTPTQTGTFIFFQGVCAFLLFLPIRLFC